MPVDRLRKRRRVLSASVWGYSRTVANVPAWRKPQRSYTRRAGCVVVVDVQAHARCHPAQRVPDDRGHRRGAEPRPRHSGATQTPWTCAVCRVTTASSALKTTWPPTNFAYARRPRTRSVTRSPVVAPAVAEQRRDADLLGVHGDRGREELIDLARAAPAVRSGRPGSAAGPDVASSGWHGRTSRAGPQIAAKPLPDPSTASAVADQRRAQPGWQLAASANASAAALVACTGMRLRAEPAHRLEPAAAAVPEDARVHAPGEPGGADPLRRPGRRRSGPSRARAVPRHARRRRAGAPAPSALPQPARRPWCMQGPPADAF